ncbi:unnamed protein product [Agarophyton chilense]
MAVMSVFLVFYALLVLSCVYADPHYFQGQAATTSRDSTFGGSVRQFSGGILDCTSSDFLKRTLCSAVGTRVNSTLEAAGLKIDREGALFSYDDQTQEKIDTGHSCSITAKFTRRMALARFSKDTDLNINIGTNVSEPIVITLKVPVHLEAKANIKQSFGAKLFGKCRRVGSDSFTVEASVSTVADTIIAVTLNPSYSRFPGNGGYAVSIRPVVAVLFDLENTDLDFKIRGLSYFSRLAAKLFGFTSTLTDGLKDVFKGKGVKKIVQNFEDTALFDFGIPLLSHLGHLPKPLQDLFYGLIEDLGEKEIEKKAKGFSSDFENLLNSKIRSAIGTDSNGVRRFVVSRGVP